ncbi:hypothetical protein ACP70R_003730 [Stipagrostis hirtigluma subsp. patula]
MAQSEPGTQHGGIEEEESLTSNLPMREGWRAPFYLYQGCWLPPQFIKTIMSVQAQFQPRQDDIILATYPKCGTTWLKALAFTIVNRGSHPITSNGHPLLSRNPHDLVPYLEQPREHLQSATELEALPSPRLLCTHIPLTLLPVCSTLNCRIVYLCREPKDVIVSFWHHVKKVGEDIDLNRAFDLFADGLSIYGPLWEHYLGYWKQSKIEPDKVLFLKYEEMIVEPAKYVKMLAEFLHVPFTNEEESSGVVDDVVRLCSFETLKGLSVNSHGVSERIGTDNSLFFRSAKIGDWRNHLSEEMAQKFDRIIEEKFRGSGLTF